MVIFMQRLSMAVLCMAFTLTALSEVRAATIQAELDRDRVSLQESFTLVFEAEGTLDGEPDFSPIEQHFDIVHKMEGSRMEIINGQISQKKEWTLTLMGKEAGFFTIPSISFGKDQSPALRIDIEKKIRSAKKEEPELLMLEVTGTPESGYVQSQFIYTIRFYRSINLLSAQISEPEISGIDAVIEKLGEDRQFEMRRDGERYRVIERKYAIFPQQSGQLTISPITFAGQLAGRARSQFNPFPGGGPIKRLRSEPLTLQVNPVPQDKIKGQWLPARNLLLMESWTEMENDALTGQVGEPLTWTLRVEAEGLTAAQIPEINPDIPKAFKAYPDQATLRNETTPDGLTGIREEKIALIPTVPGTLVLPKVDVPWWNTRTGQMEVAQLPARQIQVSPAEIPLQPVLPAPVPETALRQKAPANPAPAPSAKTTPGFWPWVSLALTVAWVMTLMGWWQAHRKAKQIQAYSKGPGESLPDFGPVKRQLKRACTQNDTAAAKDALLSWGKLKWPGRPLSLGEIQNRVGPSLSSEIRTLNAVLYSQSKTSWETGNLLWAAFEKEKKTQKKASSKPEALVPLYP